MSDTMPDHTCTPYCDGQRYMLEDGVHVVDVRSNVNPLPQWVTDLFATDGWEIIERRANCERPPRANSLLATSSKDSKKGEEPEKPYGWLIKIRKKQP